MGVSSYTRGASRDAPRVGFIGEVQRFVDARYGRRPAWVMGGAGALGVVLLMGFFTQTATGLRFDDLMYASTWSDQASTGMVIMDPLTYVTIGLVAMCALAYFLTALAQRRVAIGLATVVMIIGANATTQFLKHTVTTHPPIHVNTSPSGHSTVAMSVALGALLVAPSHSRRWVLPPAAFTATFVGAGTLVGHWHRPGDVLAAYCVCLAWAGAALAVLSWHRAPTVIPAPFGAVNYRRALIGPTCVGILFVLVGVRPATPTMAVFWASIALVSVGLLSAAVLTWTASLAEQLLPPYAPESGGERLLERLLPLAILIASASFVAFAAASISTMEWPHSVVTRVDRTLSSVVVWPTEHFGGAAALTELVAVVAVGYLVLIAVTSPPRRLVAILAVVSATGATATAMVLKWSIEHELGPHADLLSAHAVAALAAASALTLVPPTRAEVGALRVAGVLAGLGSFGAAVLMGQSVAGIAPSVLLVMAWFAALARIMTGSWLGGPLQLSIAGTASLRHLGVGAALFVIYVCAFGPGARGVVNSGWGVVLTALLCGIGILPPFLAARTGRTLVHQHLGWTRTPQNQA